MISINRLLEKPPVTVRIDDVEYEINTKWRDCLFTIEKLRDPYFMPEEKIEILLYNMYAETPINAEEAVRKAIWFLRCGKEADDEKNLSVLYDFSQDGELIYSAFLKANICLNEIEDLHWWDFLSRFSELPESRFSRIVYLRYRGHKRTKEENEECGRIGWDVINIMTEEDKALHDAMQELYQ